MKIWSRLIEERKLLYVGVISKKRDIYTTKELLYELKRFRNVRGIFLPTPYLRAEISLKNGLDLKLLQHSVKFIDVFIPRIGRTFTRQGIVILKHLEAMGIPTTLSSEGLLLSRNKFLTYQVLARNKIPIPNTVLITNPHQLEQQLKNFKHPVVIKLLDSYAGLGVIRSNNLQATKEIIEALFIQNPNTMVIVQEFLHSNAPEKEKSHQYEDIRLFVIEDRVIAAMKRVARTRTEWRTNFSRGGQTTAYNPTEEENFLALKAATLLKLEIAGVDIIKSRKGPVVLEINACPGWKGLQNTTKKNIAREIVNYALKKIKQ